MRLCCLASGQDWGKPDKAGPGDQSSSQARETDELAKKEIQTALVVA